MKVIFRYDYAHGTLAMFVICSSIMLVTGSTLLTVVTDSWYRRLSKHLVVGIVHCYC